MSLGESSTPKSSERAIVNSTAARESKSLRPKRSVLRSLRTWSVPVYLSNSLRTVSEIDIKHPDWRRKAARLYHRPSRRGGGGMLRSDQAPAGRVNSAHYSNVYGDCTVIQDTQGVDLDFFEFRMLAREPRKPNENVLRRGPVSGEDISIALQL